VTRRRVSLPEAAVGRPDLTPEKWQLIYRCCRALRIDGRMLPYLRDFLAQRLDVSFVSSQPVE